MRLIAARFRSLDFARRALAELRRRLDIGPGDASVAPLGSVDYDNPADSAVLAGRFHPELRHVVEEAVSREGGEIVLEVDDSPAPSAAQLNWPRSTE
jgi:hypothetical protein